jgi:hypothetical protein
MRSFLIATLICLAAAPAAEAYSPAKGDAVSIGLGGRGGALLAKGVGVRAIAPARLTGSALKLPVSDITNPTQTSGQLVLRGGFELRRGGRRVRIRGLLLTIKGKRIAISARVGAKRAQLFTGTSTSGVVDGGHGIVEFGAPRLKLASAAAGRIGNALRARGVRPGWVGPASGRSQITVSFSVPGKPPSGVPGSNWNFPAQTELPRPPGAVDATATQPNLVFWPGVAFVQYVRAGGGGPPAVSATAPAFGGPSISTTGQHACPGTDTINVGGDFGQGGVYSFNFPFVNGWWDAASKTGVLRYSGSMRFYYPEHFLDITLSNPIVEFNGTSSRVLFDASDAANRKLADVISIPGTAAPVAGPQTFDGTLLADGNGVIGGVYSPGIQWGCVQLGFGAP